MSSWSPAVVLRLAAVGTDDDLKGLYPRLLAMSLQNDVVRDPSETHEFDVVLRVLVAHKTDGDDGTS